jgi:hypothetical protein
MTTDAAVMEVHPSDREAEARRKLALLKAVGLDRAAPEQRELALAIAKRYDLDLLLKHLVLIEGRPFITRDGLLWIAHRSGVFDGIGVTKPVIEGDYWTCEATVWRKDMTHPITYGGRYPVKGGNAKYNVEMSVKVAESMALRRAFNVSAPTEVERWDVEVPDAPAEPKRSLKERAAAKVQEIQAPVAVIEDVEWSEPDVADVGAMSPAEDVVDAGANSSAPASTAQCDGFDPRLGRCIRDGGHPANHKNREGESWR